MLLYFVVDLLHHSTCSKALSSTLQHRDDECLKRQIVSLEDIRSSVQVHKYSRRLWAALLAEFLGLAIFQVYGGSANDDVAALANGITLAVIGSHDKRASSILQSKCAAHSRALAVAERSQLQEPSPSKPLRGPLGQ